MAHISNTDGTSHDSNCQCLNMGRRATVLSGAALYKGISWPEAGSPVHAKCAMILSKVGKQEQGANRVAAWPDAGSPMGSSCAMMLCNPHPSERREPRRAEVAWPEAGSPVGADCAMLLSKHQQKPQPRPLTISWPDAGSPANASCAMINCLKR